MDYRKILGESNPLLHFPQLYEAAVDEFSQKSYNDASLNDILKRAKMSKGSLYHHFGDKFGLFLAVVDQIYKKKLEFFAPRLQARQRGGDFFETIKALAFDTMEFMFLDKRLYHFSNRLLKAGGELTQKMKEYFSYDFGSEFGGLIRSAIDAGQIDKKYRPEFIAGLINVMFSNIDKVTNSKSAEAAFESLNLVLDSLQHGIAAAREEKK